jgi:hypothetical protein
MIVEQVNRVRSTESMGIRRVSNTPSLPPVSFPATNVPKVKNEVIGEAMDVDDELRMQGH